MIYLLLYLAKDIRCYLNLWYIFFFSSTSFNFCFCVNFSFFRPCYPGFLSHLCYICFIDTSFVVFILFISLYPIYLLDTLFLSSIKKIRGVLHSYRISSFWPNASCPMHMSSYSIYLYYIIVPSFLYFSWFNFSLLRQLLPLHILRNNWLYNLSVVSLAWTEVHCHPR